MIIVDTSLWIDVLKDKSGVLVEKFRNRVNGETIVFNRFVQMELLQGAKNDTEWRTLNNYLSTQYYLETSENTWTTAAKIYYTLRKSGRTVRSSVDCCIAGIAIENQTMLIHKDRDFKIIAQVTPLIEEYFSEN